MPVELLIKLLITHLLGLNIEIHGTSETYDILKFLSRILRASLISLLNT